MKVDMPLNKVIKPNLHCILLNFDHGLKTLFFQYWFLAFKKARSRWLTSLDCIKEKLSDVDEAIFCLKTKQKKTCRSEK